jgi:hypothetical protein
MTLEEKLLIAEELIGRPVAVISCKSGYVVEWFNYNSVPPPVAQSEVEAVALFIEFIKEHPDVIRDRTIGEDSTEDESTLDS